MGLEDGRWLLLLPPLYAVAFWLWRAGAVHLGGRRKAIALAIRLILLTAVVLGLCSPTIALSQGRQAMVFVADLSNSNAANRSAMQSNINAAVSRRPADAVAGVVAVGSDAAVDQPSSALSSFDGFQTSVNADSTNLEKGLESAAATLPDGYRRRVVVMTDGQQNVGDALTAARLLRAQGIRVDVLPQHVTTGADVRVDRVDVPSHVRRHEQFSLVTTLHSSSNNSTRIDVYRDHSLVSTRTERVVAGENQFEFRQLAPSPGVHTYEVRITPAVDAQPQNNSGSALTTVQGIPRVLVIAATPGDATNVLGSLRSTGIEADSVLPTDVRPSLTYLERYAAIVIINTPAVAFDPTALDQLIPYVRDLGHGLVVIGGQDAYGLGGYGHTPLEQVLPVKMDLPKRRQVPSVAVALIIESLEATLPVNISKEAGKGVIKLLTEQDQVAVNAAPDNGTPGWVIPLQHPLDKVNLYRTLFHMIPGDPNNYSQFLQTGARMLNQSHARIKHIIVLGDGDAHDPTYESTVRKIHASGVTVSTIITNGDGANDFATMHNIARWGGGRYYRADTVTSVPKIFLREARTVAHSGVIDGKFYPQELSSNPIVRNLHSIPPLFGYVATSAKPPAEIVLVSQKKDPVLATWQFGLGRAVAWTSDASGLWTKSWLTSRSSTLFWSNLVSWTFPPSADHSLFVSATSSGGTGRIDVTTPAILGLNASVSARILTPGLHTSTLQLQPSAPGQYGANFAAPSQGAYFITVEAHGSGQTEVGQGGVVVSYSAEYSSTGTNTPFLEALAAAGGGGVESDALSAWKDNLRPVYDQRSIAGLFWLIALLLLPIDIASRRLVMGRRDAAALRAALMFRRTPGVTTITPSRSPVGVGGIRSGVPGIRTSAAHVLARLASNDPRRTRTAAILSQSQSKGRGSPAPIALKGRSPSPPATGQPPSTASKLLEAKRRKQATQRADNLSG